MNPILQSSIAQKILMSIDNWVLFCIEIVELCKYLFDENYSNNYCILHFYLSAFSVRNLSTSMAAIQPYPAAVIACL